MKNLPHLTLDVIRIKAAEFVIGINNRMQGLRGRLTEVVGVHIADHTGCIVIVKRAGLSVRTIDGRNDGFGAVKTRGAVIFVLIIAVIIAAVVVVAAVIAVVLHGIKILSKYKVVSAHGTNAVLRLYTNIIAKLSLLVYIYITPVFCSCFERFCRISSPN